MEWIKIDRDKNGFATEKCTKEALKQLPIVIRGYDELGEYHHLLTEDSLNVIKWRYSSLKLIPIIYQYQSYKYENKNSKENKQADIFVRKLRHQ